MNPGLQPASHVHAKAAERLEKPVQIPRPADLRKLIAQKAVVPQTTSQNTEHRHPAWSGLRVGLLEKVSALAA